MRFKISVIFILIFFLQSSYAQIPNKPEKCPSVSSIKQVGNGNDVRNLQNSIWVVINHKNNYDTKDIWDFAIYVMSANNEMEAKANANKRLLGLSSVFGPEFHEEKNVWVCDYFGEWGEHAMAYISPN